MINFKNNYKNNHKYKYNKQTLICINKQWKKETLYSCFTINYIKDFWRKQMLF